VGRPHGVAGELYLDHCPFAPATLLELGALEWRGPAGASRPVNLKLARAVTNRMLVYFDGVTTREAAVRLVNGTLWVEAERLPDPGPGRSYAFTFIGMTVVDISGRELGKVADVMFNAGQPLLQLEGAAGKLLPGMPPFLQHVDREAGVITLELPAGFDEF
jgi:16S rRNA processing protein RimM